MKYDIDVDDIRLPHCEKMYRSFSKARTQMMQRTHRHELYGLVAKNRNINEYLTGHRKTKIFSEGSAQYILRKVLADTLQRVPDGELTSQFDKASKEHIWTQYIFDNKVMWSEFDGVDMMSNLQQAFKMSFIYAFAPVRIGFQKDADDDARISFDLAQWSDVFINTDCTDIRRASTVWYREYMSRDEVCQLLTEEGTIIDPTYDEDTVKYIIDHEMFTGKQFESEALGDKLKGSTSLESLELITEYRKGADEFVTIAPSIPAEFRRVKNHDPRKEIPWVFLVLEPDRDFPIGISQMEYLLSDQQFNDLFQTSAYKNLMLAMEPPVKAGGWDTIPSSFVFKPRSIWNMGNNPQNSVVEPVKIETTVLNNWAQTREAVAASMLRNLNVMDGTIANDSGVGYSKTAPGVGQQEHNKTISINNYQKRLEFFISSFANMAMRLYMNSMTGVHLMTVDEATRRRLFDIGEGDTVEGDKIAIDFGELSSDLLSFQVRAGSLMQRKEDQEREALAEVIQPFVQNLNGWSEENRAVIENEVLLPAAKRMLELSDIDISETLANALGNQIAKAMFADVNQRLDEQSMQLGAQEEQIGALAQALPQQAQAQPAELSLPPQEPIAPGIGMGGALPSSPPVPSPGPQEPEIPIPAGEQVIPSEDLLAV
jgi:hypothetical protein